MLFLIHLNWKQIRKARIYMFMMAGTIIKYLDTLQIFLQFEILEIFKDPNFRRVNVIRDNIRKTMNWSIFKKNSIGLKFCRISVGWLLFRFLNKTLSYYLLKFGICHFVQIC